MSVFSLTCQYGHLHSYLYLMKGFFKVNFDYILFSLYSHVHADKKRLPGLLVTVALTLQTQKISLILLQSVKTKTQIKAHLVCIFGKSVSEIIWV